MRMRGTLGGLALGLSMSAAALAQPQPPPQPQAPAPAQQPGPAAGQPQDQARQQGPKTDEDAIASAMSAAPEAVAAQATIVALDPGGAGLRVLRQGTNGFTCMSDDPATPAADPMCLDGNAMRWLAALQGNAPPPDSVGLVFVLVGDSTASGTDPHAQGPEPGASWIVTGPHIMIVGPAVGSMADYPRGAAPDTSAPYVMWSGTPYEHLRIPVR